MTKLSGAANYHHQVSLAFLVTNLNNKFKKENKHLIATSETRVDYISKKIKKYSVPDLIVWDFVKPINSIFWLENTTTRDLSKNIDKTILAFSYLPLLTEAFVYDYQRNIFFKIEKSSKKPVVDSKSKILKLDLSKLIRGVIS